MRECDRLYCEPPSRSIGCHRPRVPDRNAMEAILLVLRTGMLQLASGLNAFKKARTATLAAAQTG